MANIREAAADWAHEAKKNAGWLVALGGVTAITGVLAIGCPMASGLAVAFFIGIAMTIGGIARTASAFSAGSLDQGALAFIDSILTLGAGPILAARPGSGWRLSRCYSADRSSLTASRASSWLFVSGLKADGLDVPQRRGGRDAGNPPAQRVAALRVVGDRYLGGHPPALLRAPSSQSGPPRGAW